MAALVGAKYLGGASSNANMFSNEEEWIKATYSFAADTGAIADLDVLINGSSTKNYVILDFYAVAEAAVTSASTTPAIDLGIGAGGIEFWSNLGKTSLTLGAVVGMGTAVPVLLPASGKVVLGIEAYAITAGIVSFYFKVKQIV